MGQFAGEEAWQTVRPGSEQMARHSVLQRILTTRTVSDGSATFNLNHPETPGRDAHLREDEGVFLQEIIGHLRPSTTLEVGMAYAISTLYICEALNQHATTRPVHYALDPFQSTLWRGIGQRHIREAGFESIVRVIEDRSEFALPRLLNSGVRLDFALIDGWHTFDQVLVEFYYINRMLKVGGVVAFDDATRRSINRVIRYAIQYDAYRVYGGQKVDGAVTWKGRLRRRLANIAIVRHLMRPDVLAPDWELGICGTCIALQKARDNDTRGSGWYRDF